eukprot:6244932-Amphidinium_carterae.1
MRQHSSTQDWMSACLYVRRQQMTETTHTCSAKSRSVSLLHIPGVQQVERTCFQKDGRATRCTKHNQTSYRTRMHASTKQGKNLLSQGTPNSSPILTDHSHSDDSRSLLVPFPFTPYYHLKRFWVGETVVPQYWVRSAVSQHGWHTSRVLSS